MFPSSFFNYSFEVMPIGSVGKMMHALLVCAGPGTIGHHVRSVTPLHCTKAHGF